LRAATKSRGYARQRADNLHLLDLAVGEILLLEVGAHIGERQYGDRRFIGQREPGAVALRRRGARQDPVDRYWPGNILELLLAQERPEGFDRRVWFLQCLVYVPRDLKLIS
jgi:hypothetical protein